MIENTARPSPDTVFTGWGEHCAIRTAAHSYIARWSDGPPFEELYDVQHDPTELVNVAARHPDLAASFRAQLKHHVDSGWPITKGAFARQLT